MQPNDVCRCGACGYQFAQHGDWAPCPECGCDLARWKTSRYLLFGEIPLAPGADAEMLKKNRKAKSRVFSLARVRKKQAEEAESASEDT